MDEPDLRSDDESDDGRERKREEEKKTEELWVVEGSSHSNSIRAARCSHPPPPSIYLTTLPGQLGLHRVVSGLGGFVRPSSSYGGDCLSPCNDYDQYRYSCCLLVLLVLLPLVAVPGTITSTAVAPSSPLDLGQSP